SAAPGRKGDAFRWCVGDRRSQPIAVTNLRPSPCRHGNHLLRQASICFSVISTSIGSEIILNFLVVKEVRITYFPGFCFPNLTSRNGYRGLRNVSPASIRSISADANGEAISICSPLVEICRPL